MKKFSKFLSILLCLTMILSYMPTIARAAETETLNVTATGGALASDSLSISWASANFTLTTEKHNSSTAIRTSDSNHFRAYKDTKTTITALNNKMISKVVITVTESKYATALAGCTLSDGATASADGNVVTFSFSSGSVASLEIVATAQWRLNNVEVTFASDSGDDTTCAHEGTTTSVKYVDKTSHKVTCECGEILDEAAAHDFANFTCDCGYAQPVTRPEAGKAYKVGIYQITLGKTLLLTGEMDGYYFGTTDNFVAAIDVYLEETDNGYLMYYLNGETKTYIDVYKNDSGYINPRYTTEPSAVYVWSDTFGTFTCAIEDTNYYLGSFGSNSHIRPSKTSYIEADNLSTIDVSQFILHFYEIPEIPCEHPETDKLTKSDASGHWTICGLCGENKSSVEDHSYSDHICSVCRYIDVPTEVADIIACAYALNSGETFPSNVTLTGKITEIVTIYSSQYGNITVNIEVDGYSDYPIQCFRLKKGNADVENLLVGDTITVTGILKNYNGTVEFDGGCVCDAHTAHQHTYTGATCSVAGKCSICGTDGEVDTTVHSFTTYDSDNNATCTEDGTKTAYCDYGCGKTDVITVEGTALGHSYNNYVSDGNATCTEDGTKTSKCDRCDSTDTVADEGSALGHTYSNYVSDGNATCTEDGTKTSKCDCCDSTDTVADEGSALGHNYSNYVSDGNATCTEDGTKTSKCDRCDETSTVTDAGSAGHIDTVKDNLCDRCGVSLCAECIDVDTDKDHNCDVCGSKVGDHVYTTVVTDPTCTSKGYTTYTCNCGDTYTGNEVPALNHSYTDYKSNGDATCTADGTKTAKCDRCDSTNTIADTGSALGHSYTNYKSNSDATCTADGTKTAKCDRCDSTSTVADTGSALGHDYEVVVTKEPTCTEDGVKTYTCKHDATHTYTETVNALGHSLKKVEAVAATTEATGLKEHYKCETCGKLFSDDKGENEVTLADVTTDKLTPPADSDELTATLVSKELGLDNATDFTTETVGQITFTADVGENSYGNTPKYYNTGTAIRFYSQNTLTISAADGYTIKTITITTGSGNKMTADNCGITNGTATGLDTTEVVITPADGTKDVVLTYLLTSGHWKIEAINVVYEGVSSGDDTTGGDTTPDDDVTTPTDPTPTDPTPTDPTPTDPTPDDDTTTSTDPEADSTLTIKEAADLGSSKDHNTYTENKYYVTGVIKNVYNTQYGNMIITDESGNELTIYGTYAADGEVRYDALEVKPVTGDTVTVYGVIGQYNSTPQMKNGWIVKHEPAAKDDDTTDDTPTSTDPEAGSTLTIKEALELGASKDHNTYTEGKYYVTGVITEVYNTTYGNMKITDADGNILTIYGTYGADGEVRYDKLEVQPVAGDTVTVYGVIGQYNGVAQVKNGWIVKHEPAEKEDDTTTPSEPTNPSEPTTPDDDSNVTTGITITFDDTSKRTSLSEDKQVWAENGITVTNDKAESTTNVADYSNPARFYKFTTLTVTYESMASIQFHCNTEKYAEALEAALTGSDYSVVRDGKVVTVTLNAVADSFTVALTGGQVRMDSITVTTGTASDTDDDTGSTQPSTPADPNTPSEPSETTKPTEPSKPTETVKKPSKVSKPVAGESYKLGYYQAALEKTLYFAGKMNGYYLATTDDLDEAVDVYVEKVSGGLRLYFMDGKTKTYIDIVPRDNDATKTNVILTTSPSAVYVWNETFGTFVTTVNGADWYLGTYGTYNTISASKTSYIEDTSKIGVSQFPVCCYTVKEVPKTGDSISVFVAMLAMSAIGIAIIGLKKKEF